MNFNEEEIKCSVRAKNRIVKRKLILEIEFKNFPLFFQSAKKRRAVYKDKRRIDNSNGQRRIVVEKVLKNTRTVGTGRYHKITNQSIDNGKWGNEVKQKIVTFSKDFMKQQLSPFAKSTRSYLSKYTNIIVESHFHLPENYGTVKMINDQVSESSSYIRWDIDNIGTFWNKRFMDVITTGTAKAKKGQRQFKGDGLALIKDDHIKLVKGAGGSIWYPCNKLCDRKLIFSFYVEV
jgi:hypothetical protein